MKRHGTPRSLQLPHHFGKRGDAHQHDEHEPAPHIVERKRVMLARAASSRQCAPCALCKHWTCGERARGTVICTACGAPLEFVGERPLPRPGEPEAG